MSPKYVDFQARQPTRRCFFLTKRLQWAQWLPTIANVALNCWARREESVINLANGLPKAFHFVVSVFIHTFF